MVIVVFKYKQFIIAKLYNQHEKNIFRLCQETQEIWEMKMKILASILDHRKVGALKETNGSNGYVTII